jgi:outer membrane protein insertion porin family
LEGSKADEVLPNENACHRFRPPEPSEKARRESAACRRSAFGASARILIGLSLAFLVLLLPAGAARGADQKTEPPAAKLKISGYGWLGNLRLKRMITQLEFQKKPPPFFDANFIEDSSLILISKLHDAGYLRPVIEVDMTLADGTRLNRTWAGVDAEPLPRPLRARAVRFNIRKGVLYHYTQIEFTGLMAIPASHARSFFIETSGLIPLEESRVYSPDRLQRSVGNLQQGLNHLGYQNARVTVAHLERDEETGGVAVQIRVEEGPEFMVRSVRQEIHFATTATPVEGRTNYFQRPYSRLWEQDFILGIKTNYYRLGYPDTAVDMQTAGRQTLDGKVWLDLLAQVKTGPRVRTGTIDFVGIQRTKKSILRSRTSLKEGEWLDRMKAESGVYRLSRLGVFDTVELNYQPVDTNLWNVTYDVKEGKRVDVSLLFGFGSYDLLRGGVELNQYNLWGRAHNQQLRLVQSFKSSSADYTYTIPEFLGQNADFFLNGSGLRREEISFTRLEYGGGAGVRKLFPSINTEASLRYNYGILEATGVSTNLADIGALDPTVGELITDLRLDRRDNPLYPHRGYQLLGNFEFASHYLGGAVDFQRVELAASYHLPLNDSEWLHLGMRHGVAATVGGSSRDLPFTRRFFPGGANSVRGYQEGEAAPRNDQGQLVGADTYLSGTVEFEQALTPKWSVVAFVDGVGFAENLNHYPEDQALFSAGGGLNWKTLIGPVRVEYGYNLNPRPKDPVGTLQFSLGFPF